MIRRWILTLCIGLLVSAASCAKETKEIKETKPGGTTQPEIITRSPETSPIPSSMATTLPIPTKNPAITQEPRPIPPVPHNNRAVGKSSMGTISIISIGTEFIEAFETTSCYSAKNDLSIEGEYRVLFKQNEKVIEIFKWDQLKLIQPNKNVIDLKKLDIGYGEVFLFIPQYKGCRAVPLYAFAVDKQTGEAFPLRFETEMGPSDRFFFTPTIEPVIKEGELVLQTDGGPGNEAKKQVQFSIDFKTRILKQQQ